MDATRAERNRVAPRADPGRERESAEAADTAGDVRALVADLELMRFALRLALDGRVEICAEADDLVSAVAQARRTHPELCIVGRDLRGGGINAVREIVDAVPSTRVILLTPSKDIDELLAAVRAGATGYVGGNFGYEHFRRVVRAVVAGEAAVPRGMVGALMSELRAVEMHGRHQLTKREAQILEMLRRGLSTNEIAARLTLAPVTVRRHISDLVHKLQVEGREALVRS